LAASVAILPGEVWVQPEGPVAAIMLHRWLDNQFQGFDPGHIHGVAGMFLPVNSRRPEPDRFGTGIHQGQVVDCGRHLRRRWL